MAEAPDARHQAAKRMRRTARILGLFWACCWTLAMALVYLIAWEVASMYSPTIDLPPPEFCLSLALMSSPPWVAIAISWRWEAIGGVLFVLQSLVLFSSGAMFYLGGRLVDLHYAPWMAFPQYMFSDCGGVWSLALGILLPLAVGILFLASWWKSRAPAPPQATE